MSNQEKDFSERLRIAGYSTTKVRILVFQALQHKEPQTMAELIVALRDIDRASAYRTISLFEKLRIVHRLQIGWKYKLELTDLFHYHHHHMTCTLCGATTVITDNSGLESAVIAIAQSQHFQATNHQIEISGLCERCQTKK